MPSHAMKDIWYGMVLPQDCWHNLGKHCQHACGRHRGPLSCCHHSHQSCHHHSGAGLGQGHRECLVVPAQCMPPSPCRTGSIALLSRAWDSPARATHSPPVPWHTVAVALWTPWAWGDWDPRALGLVGARVPGYPGYGGPWGCQGHPTQPLLLPGLPGVPWVLGIRGRYLYLHLALYLCVHTPGVLGSQGPRLQGC